MTNVSDRFCRTPIEAECYLRAYADALFRTVSVRSTSVIDDGRTVKLRIITVDGRHLTQEAPMYTLATLPMRRLREMVERAASEYMALVDEESASAREMAERLARQPTLPARRGLLQRLRVLLRRVFLGPGWD